MLESLSAWVSRTWPMLLQQNLCHLMIRTVGFCDTQESTKTQRCEVTFYKLNVKSAETIFRANGAAFQITCNVGIKIDSNDVGGVNYSKATGLQIPHLGAKALLKASVERNAWLEAADISTDLYVDIYAAPKGYREHIEQQRAFVGEQDKLTDRAARLLSRMEGSE